MNSHTIGIALTGMLLCMPAPAVAAKNSQSTALACSGEQTWYGKASPTGATSIAKTSFLLLIGPDRVELSGGGQEGVFPVEKKTAGLLTFKGLCRSPCSSFERPSADEPVLVSGEINRYDGRIFVMSFNAVDFARAQIDGSGVQVKWSIDAKCHTTTGPLF